METFLNNLLTTNYSTFLIYLGLVITLDFFNFYLFINFLQFFLKKYHFLFLRIVNLYETPSTIQFNSFFIFWILYIGSLYLYSLLANVLLHFIRFILNNKTTDVDLLFHTISTTTFKMCVDFDSFLIVLFFRLFTANSMCENFLHNNSLSIFA